MDVTRPLETLTRWLQDARAAGLTEHDAVALATVGAAARPSVRTVSLRRVEEDGLIFTTALWTRKARELRDNPHVALLLYWPSLGRQVGVAGRAEPAERALAEELFARRDRPHQLQALVSRQGEPVAELAPMRARLAEVRREVGDDLIPCPPDWGAFRVRPDAVEYWTADPDALHDRVLLDRDDGGWRLTRLAP
jgi:pyridoxamine 5'-phosphate oxidase